MTCKHQHGDNVSPLMGWVCGQCFAILPDRPKRYGMVPATTLNTGDTPVMFGSRQEIVWQAEVLQSAQGTTLSIFLAAVARRFEKRGGLDREAAYAAALEATKMMEVPFGHVDYDWSRMSAVDVADEDMAYWDHDEPAENG